MLNVNEIVSATGGRLVISGRAKEVGMVSIDTRTLKKGEAFISIRGPHFDGKDFISEAVSKGAALIIAPEVFDLPDGVGQITVENTLKALGDIALLWRSRFKVPAIAITGSNGKSTTKQMTAAALSSLGDILKTEENFNNLIGLPLTVLRWRENHRAAVLEMGMSAPGEIARLTQIAKPDIGVITNVSPAHLELLQSVENVAKAKGELFEAMRKDGTIIVNIEDPWVRKLSKNYRGAIRTFGMQNGADVQFGRMESRGLESIDMTLYVDGKERRVHLKVPGTHNVMNAMASIAVAGVVGVSAEDAIKGLETFEPMAMRMERVQLSSGVQLVNDSYNANPLSVKEALRTVSGAKRAGRFIAVLGDMLELGRDSPSCHREVGMVAAQYKVDKLFLFGAFANDTAGGAAEKGMDRENIELFDDMEILKKKVLEFVKSGDIVLVKGSRGMQMERIINFLKDEMGVE